VAFNSDIRRRTADEGMTEAEAGATIAGPATWNDDTWSRGVTTSKEIH
jgi:hypothetical protein